MKIAPRKAWLILRAAAASWWQDKAPRLGAALAYYTLFSLGPLLLLATAVAGFFFGRDAVRGRLSRQLARTLGSDAANAIESMVANAHHADSNVIATIISIVMLLLGASGVFGQLQDALNTIWEVKPKKGRGLAGVVKDRFLSFAMVLVIGFLLLVSLVITTAIEAISNHFGSRSADLMWLWQVVNYVASFGISTVLFALMFKVLPDAEIAWRDVWVGAVVTSLLFSLGKYLISLYLAHSSVASIYGAAGSLVTILVWAYYSAQILLFGAEVAQVTACQRTGCKTQPSENAVPITAQERAQQGMEPAKPVPRPA